MKNRNNNNKKQIDDVVVKTYNQLFYNYQH